MTAVENAAVSQEELYAKAWAGFTEGNWQKDIDVRDFIQKNYTPYEGDGNIPCSCHREDQAPVEVPRRH